MKSIVLSIFELGDKFGYYGVIVFLVIMFVALIYVMRKYVKD